MIDKDALLGNVRIISQHLAWVEELVYDAAYFQSPDKTSELRVAVGTLMLATESMLRKLNGEDHEV